MRVAIPPLPNTPSCPAAQLKHEDNFIFNAYDGRKWVGLK